MSSKKEELKDRLWTGIGGFYHDDRNFLQPANFLLRPDNFIEVVSCSSGAIGRFTAQDVLRLVRHRKSS